MENARWKGRVYTATEVSQSYELEKEIRKASGRRELECTDPDCPNPILKYCHGEIKNPYFAHLNNCNCDYAEFDKGNTQLMRSVKRNLYEIFVAKGYDVQFEVKVLPHHYTHLLFTIDDSKKIAVELGTQRTTANKIETLSAQYDDMGIEYRWIVISDSNTPTDEDKTFFIKRYQLNESKLKDILIINMEGTEVTQYIVDPNQYLFRWKPLHSNNYPDYYLETGSLTDLVFEDDVLTLSGFHERYNAWLKKKKKAFDKKVAQLEEQSLKPTNSYSLLQLEPKVGMKIRHKRYGILTVLGVEKRIDKTIIKVKDVNGEISTKTWEVLLDKNQICIV
jgi:hypothetical protein